MDSLEYNYIEERKKLERELKHFKTWRLLKRLTIMEHRQF